MVIPHGLANRIVTCRFRDATLKLPSDFSATVKALLNTPPPPSAAEIVRAKPKQAGYETKGAMTRRTRKVEVALVFGLPLLAALSYALFWLFGL
jgi:hypothetical protein